MITVLNGQSIQAAINTAAPGEIIQIEAGTYESEAKLDAAADKLLDELNG